MFFYIQRTDWWLPEEGAGVVKMGEGGQKEQISTYRKKKVMGSNVKHDVCLQLITAYLKAAQTVDLKNFHHKKKKKCMGGSAG